MIRQSAHGLLTLANEAFKDRAAGRIAQGSEELVGCDLHGGIIADGLLIVKSGLES